jgi:mersacidin/lichenicidin family type 2 lantibiotic
MGDSHTIRAWKDIDYRASLDPGVQADLPASPVGTIELADDDLGNAAGGALAAITMTSICATSLPCATGVIIAISNTISCGACDTTLWHGTCAASSIGCCQPT